MSPSTDVAAIKDVLEDYAVHCCNNDFESWLSLWVDDGIQMPPNAPARVGKQAIRAGMQPAFDGMTLDLSILDVGNAEVHEDLGLTRCVFKLTLVPKDGGDPIEAIPQGKALTLYARQGDGTWKICYDCYNLDVLPE